MAGARTRLVGHARQQRADYRHCFTYENSARADGQTIKNALLELLKSARRKIFIASFRIGDKDLIDALYDAARRLRGGVYVITELDLASLHAFGRTGKRLCHAAKGRIGCKPRNEGLRPTQAAERVAHLGERFE